MSHAWYLSVVGNSSAEKIMVQRNVAVMANFPSIARVICNHSTSERQRVSYIVGKSNDFQLHGHMVGGNLFYWVSMRNYWLF